MITAGTSNITEELHILFKKLNSYQKAKIVNIIHNSYTFKNSFNVLNGYYQNVWGLRIKLTELRCNFIYDFFIAIQTWLNDQIILLRTRFYWI